MCRPRWPRKLSSRCHVPAPRKFTGLPCVRGHIAERFVSCGVCVECNRQNAAARRRSHPEQTRAAVRIAHAKYDYSASYEISNARWRAANPDKLRQYRRRSYEKSDPAYWRAKRAERRAREKQQMPAWADREAIAKIYAQCPKGHHVDHVIPLRGRLVSGLHVEANLQYLTASANHRKHNLFEDAHA